MRHLRYPAVLTVCLLLPIDASAQDTGVHRSAAQVPNAPAPLRWIARCLDRAAWQPPDSVRLSCVTTPASGLAGADRFLTQARVPGFAAQIAAPPRRRSATRVVLGAIVGATGGFFAGAYTGAWIEGDDCHCDDPGLKGAVIGGPIGAAAGGILGGLYLF